MVVFSKQCVRNFCFFSSDEENGVDSVNLMTSSERSGVAGLADVDFNDVNQTPPADLSFVASRNQAKESRELCRALNFP